MLASNKIFSTKLGKVILECLLKWFAPILSFTTEEIYHLIHKEDNNGSIHLQKFVKIPNQWKNEELNSKWDKLKLIRDEANISIESKRADKIIGSSLEANIEIKIKDKDMYSLAQNHDFSEICITSSASISNYNNLEKEIDKKGTIESVIKPNQTLLVQIIKEPISTKGPRISSELSFAGRFLVLIPFSNRISVSQKIRSKDERNRLKDLIEEFRPKGFGVIIRTVAQGKKTAELSKDLQGLYNQWINLCKKINGSKVPSRILSELNRGSSILRDVFDEKFKGVYCNDKSLCYELKDLSLIHI